MSTEVDAAVLALIDPQKRILVCKRSDSLRSHPGEACLPGGKREDGDVSLVETALREAEEEIRVNRELVTIRYELEPVSSLSGVWVHTVVGTIANEPELSINTDEVAKADWIPLELFLKNDNHFTTMHLNCNVHGFDLPQLRIFGLTADLCILIAIRELGLAPEFDINPGLTFNALTTNIMQFLTPSTIIETFFAYYYENVQAREEPTEKNQDVNAD